MAEYDAVKKELAAGTPPELICATCPWDRLCVQPPTMTEADIQRVIAEAEAKDRAKDPTGRKMPTGMLLTTITFAGRDSAGPMCPVFTLRLRGDRRVADSVRAVMRAYEPEGGTRDA